jgi:radical SAM protein (TIGR01212 family)
MKKRPEGRFFEENMEHYYSVNKYLRERFGCKVYKLALSGGFTCPNRDGTLGNRGCIFCSGGSGEFAADASEDVGAAIEKAKAVVGAKEKNAKYIAYFQSYTSTYGPTEKLERLFTSAISHPDIAALSVATRPDCLPEDTLELLAGLNRIKPVWVELGLQTIHPETARYIRRSYELPVFDRAVRELKKRGITVIVHMIIGLPGENDAMIYDTASYIGSSGADGVKFQLLHVLRGTDLALDYAAGKFQALTMERYFELLEGCIRRIPPDMVIHRLTGDGAKRELVAPLWSADKKRVINAMSAAFDRDNVVQGELRQV